MEAIPIRRAETNVVELLASAIEALEAQARAAQIDLAIEASDVPSISIEAGKIAWAVTTLVGNALRHVRRGGRHLPGGSIRVKVARDGESLAISVYDDGPGIPEEKVPFLFRRQDGKRHALGLSLVLIQEVIAAHGGSIDVKSKSGADHGTEITLRLPLAKSST